MTTAVTTTIQNGSEKSTPYTIGRSEIDGLRLTLLPRGTPGRRLPRLAARCCCRWRAVEPRGRVALEPEVECWRQGDGRCRRRRVAAPPRPRIATRLIGQRLARVRLAPLRVARAAAARVLGGRRRPRSDLHAEVGQADAAPALELPLALQELLARPARLRRSRCRPRSGCRGHRRSSLCVQSRPLAVPARRRRPRRRGGCACAARRGLQPADRRPRLHSRAPPGQLELGRAIGIRQRLQPALQRALQGERRTGAPAEQAIGGARQPLLVARPRTRRADRDKRLSKQVGRLAIQPWPARAASRRCRRRSARSSCQGSLRA